MRSYNTEPIIWDGDPNCQHEWGTVHPPGYRSSDTKPGPLQSEGNTNRQNLKSNVCVKCGSWKGELGSEPTPEDFIRHLTSIYRELKRVLRNDGVFWANIGDSFASGKGTCFNPGGNENSLQRDCKESGGLPLDRGNKSTLAKSNLKPKDMIGIPWALAFSLRADGAASPQTMYTVERIRSALLDDYDTWNDVPKNTKRTIEDLDEEWMKAQKGGWYLRADLPWVKRNSLPSSVTDRPGSSIEHIFLFSKSPKYYYDHIATMQQSSESYNKDKRPRGIIRQKVNENTKYDRNDPQYAKIEITTDTININTLQKANVNFLPSGNNGAIIFDSQEQMQEKIRKQDGTGNNTYTGFNARYEPNSLGLRYMRDSDFFFKTWQGLLHNEDGEPVALVINPKGYKGAHFAAFPVQLVEPLILAGTSDHGVCPHCGAPWVRQTKKGEFHNQSWGGEHVKGQEAVGGVGETSCLKTGGTYEIITVDWKPTCTCDLDPIPATVIDPFSGSSATGVACKLHNRTYIGIELNPEYVKLGEKRIKEGK